jgi:tetratricopeptide (TPR) repeat protein
LEELLETDRLVREGARLAAMGRSDEALAALEEAVRRNPNLATGLLHLALALTRAGRFAEAASHLRRALELRPESAAFHLLAGETFFHAEEYESARAEFARALELNPGNELARNYRILNEWASGSQEAREQLNPEELPDSTPFLAQLLALIETELRGRSVDLVDHSRRTPWLDRPRVAYALWRGELARKAGNLGRASSYADLVVEMQPGHPAGAELLRQCREAALSAAQQRVMESPQSPEAHMELASHLADMERFEEAERELNEARRLAAEAQNETAVQTPEVSRAAGRVLYGLGRIDEAIEQVRAGAEPGFSMLETHYCLGLCHLAQGRRPACFAEFERLAEKVWWAVPQRYREYLAWRRSERARRPSEAQT